MVPVLRSFVVANASPDSFFVDHSAAQLPSKELRPIRSLDRDTIDEMSVRNHVYCGSASQHSRLIPRSDETICRF